MHRPAIRFDGRDGQVDVDVSDMVAVLIPHRPRFTPSAILPKNRNATVCGRYNFSIAIHIHIRKDGIIGTGQRFSQRFVEQNLAICAVEDGEAILCPIPGDFIHAVAVQIQYRLGVGRGIVIGGALPKNRAIGVERVEFAYANAIVITHPCHNFDFAVAVNIGHGDAARSARV